ncbi:MAG: polysaccharide deacetylase family protein [Bacteroidota bacterium]|nr:polysaccharide deacetylase family protein [Bacteroidota bacterium]MDP3144673.1 polysaccharide deacetylase family protein [Bacteroidota bacterium]MDP3557009.1 polysaccharide deacetylase family protein [Bacteroidota bacterium]
MGLDVLLTINLEEFINSSLPKINYSDVKVENCLSIKPHPILFDVGIKDYPIEVSNHEVFQKIFFKGHNTTIPFDLFGASFWLLTRFEEYLPFKTDKHNRFNYKSSLAYQYDFIDTPLINLWINKLQLCLNELYPNLKFKEHQYSFISTIDVDNAFKYKHKGVVRAIAGYLHDVITKNLKSFKERFLVIVGQKKDPYDCYAFLIDVHKKQNIKAIYFFLLGDYGPNDKNQAATNLNFQALMKNIADYSSVGIHPSYGSNSKAQQLKIEISRLANIIHSPVIYNRQHFSMLKFPQTYHNLLKAGIEEDFSMGYTNYNGFRASYCYPFNWYNLENELLTPLTINSFCVAESTLKYFSLKENKTLMDLALPIINEVKKYNGQLISVFHNDTFNEDMKKFYIEFIEIAKK